MCWISLPPDLEFPKIHQEVACKHQKFGSSSGKVMSSHKQHLLESEPESENPSSKNSSSVKVLSAKFSL